MIATSQDPFINELPADEISCGELVICATGETLCFVEVRSRADSRHGLPEETISRTKRRRIARAAEHYLMAMRQQQAFCRFDVVAIDGAEVRLIQDAFRLEDC